MEGLEGAHVPLFLREDWQQVVGAMLAFNGSGLVSGVPPEGQEAAAPVELSSDDSHEGDGGDFPLAQGQHPPVGLEVCLEGGD